MPTAEVSRSDSNRSDASQKPRVSFNRDVHVKRIVPRENNRVGGAVTGINGGTVLTSPVRKERVKKSKKELAEEAAKVISQVDRVGCVANDKGTNPDKFYTLPNRKKSSKEHVFNSLDRRTKRRNSLEAQPPKKPPRTFASSSKPSIFDLFKKTPTKKSNLRRSVSDASALRSKAFGPVESKPRTRSGSVSEAKKNSSIKKQLSPIIEVNQREDYFDNKENIDDNDPKRSESVTEQLKNYIDEVDEELYKETGIRIKTPPPDSSQPPTPLPIIIDLDKAEKISSSKKHKLNFNIGKKLKNLTQKKTTNDKDNVSIKIAVKKDQGKPTVVVPPTVQSTQPKVIPDSPSMIHSSQKPVDKPPLTKGRTVNSIIKRLSSDSCSSPPPTRTNALIMPNMSLQHNNNQPFSYTRGISPDKYRSNEDLPTNSTKPVIYAQVVCGNKGLSNEKQTIHTAYTGRRQPQSDSDEGLGGEDSSGFNRKSFTRFGDDRFDSDTEKLLDDIDKYKAESPILPKYRSNGFHHYNGILERGRGDGMDAKRRESLTEPDNILSPISHSRTDLSARRDLLESRLNRRITEKTTPSPEYYPTKPQRSKVLVSEKSSKYYRSGSTSPVGYKEKYISETKTDQFGERRTESRTKKYFGENDQEPKSLSDYRSSPENNRFESSHNGNKYRYRDSQAKLLKDKNIYRSTPEINHVAHVPRNAYHDSLPREDKFNITSSQRFRSERFLNREGSDRRNDRFVDSGIENDCRRDSSENYPSRPSRNLYHESEDEGFASSLLIANERNQTETRKSRKDYDSDLNPRDDFYRNGRNKYTPRERSIDDGSHYDPRLDKDVKTNLKKKPPKPEKRSGLEKVKSLFTSKKKDKSGLQKTKPKPLYSCNTTDDERSAKNGHSTSDYRNRRRLSTPSPTRDKPKRSDSIHGSWFKSLDRLAKRKSDKQMNGNITSTEDESTIRPKKLSSSTSNLRFFGDTDQESNGDSVKGMKPKRRSGLISQSSRDLHNITEEKRHIGKKNDLHHKSLSNISESDRELKDIRSNLKPPLSPTSRYAHDRDDRRWRSKRPDINSVESSTEGDSSQQSQRSIVYLHAATVGDIPGPEYLRSTRAASREDLTSTNSSFIQPQVKTLSRSFSVLAPWRPRHPREGIDIDYTPYNKGTKKYEQKPARTTLNRNDNSTLKRKAQENRRNYQQSRSKEYMRGSREDMSHQGSTSTLYKKKDRLPRENSRYVKDKEESRRMNQKSQSVESIARKSREKDVSRSVSMPRDTEKTAGWFRKTKKSGQRL